jgi:hypothetical protein
MNIAPAIRQRAAGLVAETINCPSAEKCPFERLLETPLSPFQTNGKEKDGTADMSGCAALRSPSGSSASALVAETLLPPGISLVMIPVALPETELVTAAKLQAAQPFAPFPEVAIPGLASVWE